MHANAACYLVLITQSDAHHAMSLRTLLFSLCYPAPHLTRQYTGLGSGLRGSQMRGGEGRLIGRQQAQVTT